MMEIPESEILYTVKAAEATYLLESHKGSTVKADRVAG